MNRRASAQLWTAAVAAACDRYTMDERGMPSALLMERAALCVSHAVMELRGATAAAVGVLVGPGNNGGDGLAVARQLHGWGVPVAAWLVTDRQGEAMAGQLELARSLGVVVHQGLPTDAEANRVWVDAMLGTGSRGPLRGGVLDAVQWLGRHRPPCVAVDVPTGVDPDGDARSEPMVCATTTVTFARSKVGLHQPPGRAAAGRVVVADIGLWSSPQHEAPAHLLDPFVVAEQLQALPTGAHKGQRGHVGVAGGSPGAVGAALLAGTAALRGGAGLVTVASPDPSLGSALAVARPELMTAPWSTQPEHLLGRATALVVGPGLTAPEARAGLARLFVEDPRAAVWDASALDEVPLGGGDVPAGARILTPHPGEAARMLDRFEPGAGWTSSRVQAVRLQAARTLARAAQAVVVLKGEGSVVAEPGGYVTVGISGGPALATAGSGDVLAGLGGALLARGLSPVAAACAAVHVHGVAGERLGDGPGPVALDIADAVPAALHAVMTAPAHPRWPALVCG